MDMMEFLRTRRTFRKFTQQPVPDTVLDQVVEAARLASATANRQTLKYIVVSTPGMTAQVQPHVHWAGYLPPELGCPGPDETPTAFVAVLQDERMPGCTDTDAGLALANMTAAAWAHGVGSCIMGAIDRPALCALLHVPEGCRLHTMLALGYPAKSARVVEMKDGNIKYYLDENGDTCVPKRPTAEILLARL